jgi:hypothetical protein
VTAGEFKIMRGLKMRRPALVLLGFLMSLAVTATKAQTPGTGSKPATVAPSSSVAPKPIHLPLFFEANQGQADSRVRFMARGQGYTLLLTPTETILTESKTQVYTRSGAFAPFENPLITTKTSRGSLIRMQLVGANSAPAMTGLEELPGKVNYLIGNDPSKWQTEVPLYSQARTEQVYPGVNLLFHGDERELEYDFVVAPGADPSKIAFRIRGAARMKINAHGDLVLHGTDSDFVMHKPVIYQTIASERRPIEGSFVKKGKNEVTFRLGAYDHSQELVIDPAIGFSSFLGGGSEDISGGFAIDDSTPGSPKLYLSGFTGDSTTFPEPSTIIGSGTSMTAPAIVEVGFIAKVDPTMTGAASLDYLTFIGGNTPNISTQQGCLSAFVWMTLDKSQGAANIEPVVGGITNCSNFPSATVLNPVTGTGNAEGTAALAARITPSGKAIDKAVTLGGNSDLGGGFVAVNGSGDVILTGDTQANNLPTKNAYVNTFDNGAVPPPFDDCFVTVLNRADLSINYLTYLNVGGGSNSTKGGVGCGAFEDSLGNILAGGNTFSPTAFNLGAGGASLANGFQTTFSGNEDTFAMKLNPSLVGVNQLLYATYYGGGGGASCATSVDNCTTRAANGSFDLGNGVVAIVGGTTSNTVGGDIPLKNAFQTQNKATGQGIVGYMLLVNTGQTGPASLLCSTYFGGSGGNDIVSAVTYDAGDPTNFRIIIGGRTNSPTDFPTMNPIQPYVGAVVNGMQSPDGFLSVLNVPTPSQTAFNASLVFSTYIGGSNPPAQFAVTQPPTLLEDDRINAVAVDANHTVYAVGESNAPGGFFANTNPTTTVNGFQTTCTSCNPQSPLFPIDDVVMFSIGTGANATLQSIAVAPTSASIAVGQTQQFRAVGNFNDGTEKDITSLVTWTTVPTGFATMSTTSPGLAMGVAAGSTAITPALGTATVLNTGALTVTGGTPITLQVKTAGTAFGTVTDNLGQINCTQAGGANPSGNCTTQYPSGTQVTLTATTPGTGAFVGAPTACTGTGNTCQFTIMAAETVTATFTPGPGMFPLTVVAGTPHTGGGTITSAPSGINCTLTGTTTSGTCTQNFPAGTLVTLTSAPGPGSGFFGWTGTMPNCLASSAVSCLLNMSAATTATVEFTSGGGTVNVTVMGAGNVTDTANAGEINCTNTAGGTQTGTCSGGYTLGAGVTLTATPAAGATFSGWTGASCTNPTAATCSFQVINTTPIAVGATFAAGGGAATHFSVTAPATAAAGSTFNFIVTALTAANTTATGYTGTVHFTSSDGKAVLPANSALLNGVMTLPAVLNTAGAQTITATDTVTASITGTSGTITVAGVGPSPMLVISKTHAGNFTQGQQGAQYSLTVTNSGAGPTSGNAVSTTVQSTGSIYATGGGSTPPTMITLPSGATSVVFNSVTGSITTGCASTEGCIVLNNGTGNNANDPDGVGAVPAISSNTGTSSISGMMAPGAGYLVGLFVPAGGPAGAAPAALDFTSTGLGTSFTSLSPLLDQVFFIGDGLTGNGTGTQQTFNIPTGAVQLWLGISDAGGYVGAPGAYGDNLGLYTVGLSVNAPGSSAVTVTETAPSGLTLVSMAGTGWTCGGANPANVCTRSDILAGGASYPAITVSVNVAADATSPQVNTAGVTGGGSAPANASDSTVIESAGVTQPLTVVTAGTGTGTVTGNGINCVSGSANACMASLPAGTQVVLTQAVTNGSTFAGWNGAPTSCTVAGATCTFTMPGSAETVTATFTAATATLKSIAVTPANPTEPINSSVQFTATGTFSDNSTKDITATVTWASSNSEAATINASGLVTVGGTAGLTTTISATLNEVTGSTLLTVSSSPIAISVTPPAGGAFPPVPPGGTLAIGIVLTSTPGFSGTVTFGCTTSSPTITCAPDPATVTLTPTGPTDVAIVLNTFCKGTTTTGSVPVPGGFGGGFTLLLLSLTLGGTLWMWRRSPRWAMSFAILVLMAIGGASCASPPKGPNGATQPGNYTVTFSATVNGVTTSTAPIPFMVE